MREAVPSYECGTSLAGFAVDASMLEIVDELEMSLSAEMPELDMFRFSVDLGRLLFHPNDLRIRDAHGSRAFRREDASRFERAVEKVVRARAPGEIRRILRLDRVYGFDWSSFRESTWKELDSRYPRTLRWLAGKGIARWFCADEKVIPHLWGSVEPPGLHVAGILEDRLLAEWHEAFVAVMTGLPFRKDLG